MQDTQEFPLGEAQKFVSNLCDKTINELCSEEQSRRVKAVNEILRQLNSHKEGNKDTILQSLPIALIQSREYIGTIYFIEECIRNGAFFDPKVIDIVISAVSRERLECLNDDDTEAADVITKILHRFYNIVLSHSEYQREPEIYLSIGIKVERDDSNVLMAIHLYNEAIGLGSMDGYFCAGSAYEALGNYDMSANIFDAAYQLSGEIRFFHRYIHALCKAGKRTEAYKYYLLLQSKNKNIVDGYQEANKLVINPFIVYAEDISSDEDLREFEFLMTSYFEEGTFEPSESLRIIAEKASIYIANEIEKESAIIEKLNLASLEEWTTEQDIMYSQSIRRRLFLMQTHIIILQDSRYMEFYLRETRNYIIEGNDHTQRMMRNFFNDSFSKYVHASYCNITQDEESDTESMDLVESMRLHLIQIRSMYSQASYYGIIRDTIEPFIDDCLKMQGRLDDSSLIEFPGLHYSSDGHKYPSDDEDEEESIDTLGGDDDMIFLKKENKNEELMAESTRKMYEEYIGYMDRKYGMFYRRGLQQLFRDEMAIPPNLKEEYERALEEYDGDHFLARDAVISNMEIFLNYPDIALFFFLEKIILGHKYLSDDQTMESFVMKYHLDTLELVDSLLLASVLYENGEQYDASEYVTHVSGMLDIPKALYMLMESLRYMDEKDNPDGVLERLDAICQEEYDAEGFFEHFSILAQDIFTSDQADDDEIGYMLLASANMKCFQGGDPEEIIAEFEAAGDRGVLDGYIGAGDILEEEGEYHRAMEYYNRAYLLSPTIVTIKRILNVLLVDNQFDEAWEYINMAIRDDLDVAGYISAWYLYQGRNTEAMKELCKIIQSNGRIDLSFPEPYTDFMLKTIESELNSSDISIEQSNLMILASYIKASFTGDEGQSDPLDYMKHVECIEWLIGAHNQADASDVLLKSIPILTGDIDLDNNMPIIDQLSGYLHLHLVKIHGILTRYHKANCDKKDAIAAEKTFNLINYLSVIAIRILKRFPNTEKYILVWENVMNLPPTIHDANRTVHKMPEIIQ